ncbi:MAG: hypothetical protein NTZ40_14775 [Cyanobacteria bacterium]|nr:hypothetical protein [Cyanobacteriota bacterium]
MASCRRRRWPIARWPQERIASALLQRSGGRPVHLLLHGGARGADRAIGRAAQQSAGGSSPSPLIGAAMAALPVRSAIASCWSRPLSSPRPTHPRRSAPQCW